MAITPGLHSPQSSGSVPKDALPQSAPRRTALVVIARNEAPRLPRLLASMKAFVDEMVVLDTGSTDATREVALATGARLGQFTWCDDFSAARNAALDLAHADWHVVLDADEWLVHGGEWLQSLRQTEPDFVGTIDIESDFFDNGRWGQGRHRIERVLPGWVRYRGRVHEQPVHQLAVRHTPVGVGHEGYTPERAQAKDGRNRQLLMAELESSQGPASPYLLYQLGKDREAYGDYTAAAAWYERVRPGVRPQDPWMPEWAARSLFVLKKCGQHAQALELAQAFMADCATSVDFYFALGDLFLDWTATAPGHAEELLELAGDAWKRCLELGEGPHVRVAGRGSHLAAHNLCLVLQGLGREDEAADVRRRHAEPVA